MTPLQRSPKRYTSPEIAMHWGMVLLVVLLYVTIEWKSYLPEDDSLRVWLHDMHRSIGVLVFLLVWLRLWVRATSPRPRIEPPISAGQEFLARLFNYTLYIFMIVLPATGYLLTNAVGGKVLLFGLPLPTLIEADSAIAYNCKEIHDLVGNAGYFMIGTHALAALWHHYVRKDNTLRRMLP